jgi:phage terminase large subunit-like protein
MTMDAALDLLAAMVLEDGSLWGERAAPFQWDAARLVLDLTGAPPYVWDSRPRGGSKTTDAAGWSIAAMLTLLPPASRLYVFASDRDQARLVVEAAAGLVARTPILRSAIEVGSHKVTATRSGSTLDVLAADAASAYGLKPHLVIADEVCQWPSTANAKALWEAATTAMPKVAGSKLVCITTSGDPTHWTREIYNHALSSPLWAVRETPGPLPWIDPERLADERDRLPESSFRRLHLNEWAAAEDRLVAPEDLEACVVLDGPLAPESGRTYALGLDVGLVNDRTVAAVVHSEPVARDGTTVGTRLVLDRLQVWQGSRAAPVPLAEVEEWVSLAASSYRPCTVVFDPFQAVQLAQGLQRRRIRIEQFTFTQASVAKLALTMHDLLRHRSLALPNDPELVAELSRVSLRETRPGVFRIDHDAAEHDDRVIALAMAAYHLFNQPVKRRVRILT